MNTPETDGITFKATKDMMPPYDTVPSEFARRLERERDMAKEDAKRATYDATQETIKVGRVKSAWIEACRERDKARDTVLRLRRQRAIARKFGEQMERERDDFRADQINHENLSMRYMDERDKALESLAFIAEWGGKTHETEYGDIRCDGGWCAEQARSAIYLLKENQ
jgi:hypothetical protein